MWMNWKLSTWANIAHPIETLVVRVRLAACALILTLYMYTHPTEWSYYCVVFFHICDAATRAKKNVAISKVYRTCVSLWVCRWSKIHPSDTWRVLGKPFDCFVFIFLNSLLSAAYYVDFAVVFPYVYRCEREKKKQCNLPDASWKNCRLSKTGFYYYLSVKYNCGYCRHTAASQRKTSRKDSAKIRKMWRTFPWYFLFRFLQQAKHCTALFNRKRTHTSQQWL